jgi:DNA-binding transcriptional ArsR family regulator
MAFSKLNQYDLNDQITCGFMKGFAYPVRLDILRRLHFEGPLCVQILAQGQPICKETLSEHLKTLRKVQLVNWEEKYPYTFYSLDEENMAKAIQYIYSFLKLFQMLE